MLAGCAWDRLSQREKDTPLPLLQGFEDSVIVKFVPKQDLPSRPINTELKGQPGKHFSQLDAISCK